ncbi:MAG: M20/M25/M40 family metallo-hydrolase [Verrucomicrobia bacterium]|nr:M20/M25/M40 family metallo-hydrolase [Verrucomicrobiota bacterium]
MDPSRLLAELVALPSVNPAFLPAGDSRAGEQRVAEFLLCTAARAGLDVEQRDVIAGRANLLARLAPSGRTRQRVLLAPHLDTVGGDEPQFRPQVKKGRLYGRGACDTKGSVAAMLSALLAVAGSPSRPRQTEIVFAGLVDEEYAQRGSRALAASGFRASLAIVGEPTRLRVVTAHKGDLWLRLETRGRAAHGATPHLGRNAVHDMARVVDVLETEYAAALRRHRHPLLGHATVNVGAIHGGTQPNIVPDRCSLEVDRRTLPGETRATVLREIRTLLRRHRLTARLADSKAEPCPALETNPERPLVREFMAVAGQARPLGVHFFCDAAVLAGGGIPSVVFGPGDIAQAHTADEWISLRQVERATALLTRFLSALP